MKLVHLSDLHLGKRVHEVSMLDDQAYILSQIIQIVDEEQADAVLIAGDIYDKTVPPAEAVTLLDDFLCSLAHRNIPVFLISGNHDSPERLSFGSRLMEHRGIHIAPVYPGSVSPVSLSDSYGEVRLWLLPFLKPSHVRRFFPDEPIETYTDACRAAVQQMDLDPTIRNILVTHQFVTGAQTCDSEELLVGGTDHVDASVFSAFDYVALGHIHSPQNIRSNQMRYCGTPLKYSFSEASHHKSVTIVTLGKKGELFLTLRPLIPMHDLRQIRGSFSSILEHAPQDCHTQDYVHVILTDEEDVPEAVGQLRKRYPNLLKLSYDNTRTSADCAIEADEAHLDKSPLELFETLYQQQNNQPMSDIQRTFSQALITAIQEEAL